MVSSLPSGIGAEYNRSRTAFVPGKNRIAGQFDKPNLPLDQPLSAEEVSSWFSARAPANRTQWEALRREQLGEESKMTRAALSALTTTLTTVVFSPDAPAAPGAP
jgi:hypothetical protein